jgi:hypothetical protein
LAAVEVVLRLLQAVITPVLGLVVVTVMLLEVTLAELGGLEVEVAAAKVVDRQMVILVVTVLRGVLQFVTLVIPFNLQRI